MSSFSSAASEPLTIVGSNHYSGTLVAGEKVKLVREPTNNYSHNAIKVVGINDKLCRGHIKESQAALLSPQWDANEQAVKNRIAARGRGEDFEYGYEGTVRAGCNAYGGKVDVTAVIREIIEIS